MSNRTRGKVFRLHELFEDQLIPLGIMAGSPVELSALLHEADP